MTHRCNYEMSHNYFDNEIKAGDCFWHLFLDPFIEKGSYYTLEKMGTDGFYQPICLFKFKHRPQPE